MTNSLPDPTGPRIDIHLGADRIEIRQHRPAVAQALVGMPAEAALERIPMLLPICGVAQSVAAARAVAAARDRPLNQTLQHDLEQKLWHEQALAAAWRFTVDWPDLLGEARQLEALKRVHQATDANERSAGLQVLTSGVETIDNLDDLLHWVQVSDCVAARVARLALESGHAGLQPGSPVVLMNPDQLQQISATALACEPFDPLDPDGSPLEVGPLAMGRDFLTAQLQAAMGGTVTARILAQVLDARVIARALQGELPATPTVSGWATAAGSGVGCAITARGPVFHRVVLEPSAADTIADWRVLAPTDWHFGPRGPLALKLTAVESPTLAPTAALNVLVASYDPCAPCTLHSQVGGG